MKTVLITGSQGFIGSYLCAELLSHGYRVIGIDNFSKYGPIARPHDNHPNFKLIEDDVCNILPNWTNSEHNQLLKEVDFIIALAAKIGGISYFHKYAFDLFSENEKIMAATFDYALALHKAHHLERILVISSSMVYESTNEFPSHEEDLSDISSPLSSYGRQKLVCEWWADAANEQYGLPYTIIRPFNCVGVGEEKALGEHEVKSGNIKLLMSHVLPDLVNKVLQGQKPLHILGSGEQIRCYTNGKDIARGIRMALESTNAINDDFNISTSTATSVLELAELVWRKIHKNSNEDFSYICEDAFEYDVQKRIPDVSKAKELLGFEAQISLDESVDEVINWMKWKNSEKIIS